MQFKSLLITGGYGFIGSHFINHYFDHNPECFIVNLDAMYYCASETNVRADIRQSGRYKFVKGNLCNEDLLAEVLRTYNIDCVIHFAAQSHVQNSFDTALQYTKDNVLGTHTLLHCCKEYGGVNRFIHVSTDEVYGESMLDENEPKKHEASILCPTNPYAATKAGAELLAQAYYKSFGMPIIITRGNNVYGPNQYPEKLIPLFIQQLQNRTQVTIQGDGSNVRGFLHVYDVFRAFLCVLESGQVGEIYNIGADEDAEYSVMQVATELISRIHPGDDKDTWIRYIADRPFNDKRYYVSNDKVKALGWDITVDFKTGLDILCSK
jgi:UDP-glucose 4,6-dehydratase